MIHRRLPNSPPGFPDLGKSFPGDRYVSPTNLPGVFHLHFCLKADGGSAKIWVWEDTVLKSDPVLWAGGH